MTADERLEALLNRAGQTISDLPKKGMEVSEPYPLDACPKANGAAWDWYLNIGSDMDDYDSTRTKLVLKQYILHLTDIIDRMEWALDKTIRERAYLSRRLGDADCDCDICVYADVNEAEMPCYQCDIHERHFEFAEIQEDWRVDDE